MGTDYQRTIRRFVPLNKGSNQRQLKFIYLKYMFKHMDIVKISRNEI